MEWRQTWGRVGGQSPRSRSGPGSWHGRGPGQDHRGSDGQDHGTVDETMEDQMDMMEPVEIESTMAEPAEEMASSAEQKTTLGIRRPWQNRGNDGFSGHDRAGMAVTWSTEFS